jgi:hypothetical protein
MSAPMHVLYPPRLTTQVQRIAIAPITAPKEISEEFEQAMLAQQPSTPGGLQVVASTHLRTAAEVRLASFAPVAPDQAAVHAAHATGAQVVLIGEIVQQDLESATDAHAEAIQQLADQYTKKKRGLPPENLHRPERIAVAWRVLEVPSGRMIGSHTLAINRLDADRLYPDLQLVFPTGRERVLAAGARQSWQAVTPYLERESAVLALPWLQPGASQVRRGNGYALQGRWDLAENEWNAVARRYPFSNAAHHNLALAYAAREDFESAKAQLGEMNFVRSRTLQSETLMWLDQRHRWHTLALNAPPPAEGFAFPDPNAAATSANPGSPTADTGPVIHSLDELPPWVGVPFIKPPGWTWRQWLFQPWAL